MSICLYVLAHKHCCTACVLVLVIYVVYHATFSALLHSLSIAFPLLACHLQLSSSASFGTTERIPGARWPPNSLEKKPLDAFACVASSSWLAKA